MKEVIMGLYIGDVKDAEAVVSGSSGEAITHVLSLLSFLPSALAHHAEKGVQWQQHSPRHLARLWLPWDDTPDQNILDTLELCVDFITRAVQNGSILVHCLAGVSRSAAAVIAYLMKYERLSLEGALSALQNVSKGVLPNDGFLEQLKLFESMGCTIDRKSHTYKKFHLEKLGELYSQGQWIDKSAFAVDPASSPLDTSSGGDVQTPELNSSHLYRCKKCRRIVASQENVLTHDQEKGGLRAKKREKGCVWDEESPVECTSIFVEPMQWMKAVQEGGVMGKLLCANCNARLGNFNWAGVQCSCGAWIVPAFQLHKSRIDVSKF